ncbi:uncharacterized protein FOMMEDRAFT_150294 [Fomitiporia mediterranea MF3/22]|uniref:uncharacterized protein n=1 Tax=Fomitiporia mediterranea (strain MF3/22) TaxID=694068 RepID=UPI0004408627|nr:uncharacterized protein FOMMEDRAFT_150294 [Fomitiporia mediterranea MF3/22]EJD07752.1 hypothetical protein FOMMEDRAFT_150294 [Fomitiporia mediterranea MF3/22]
MNCGGLGMGSPHKTLVHTFSNIYSRRSSPFHDVCHANMTSIKRSKQVSFATQETSESSVSGTGPSKRTRWDVGDPERGRKEGRAVERARAQSPSEDRRKRRERSPLDERQSRKHKATRYRSRSPSSDTSRRHARHKEKRHGRSRSRSPSSSSSSSSSYSRSRSRPKDRHRKARGKDRKDKEKRGRSKDKERRKRSRSPDAKRSVLTGKKIKMKVHKTADDLERDAKRQELLTFLNSTFE